LSSENPKDLLSKEADLLKKQLDEVNNTIRTYENNLGFFKNAKGGNALLKDVEDKVAFEKQKVEEISAKRKKVIEELTKLREAQTPKAQA
jgi:prefoldin subunit 5